MNPRSRFPDLPPEIEERLLAATELPSVERGEALAEIERTWPEHRTRIRRVLEMFSRLTGGPVAVPGYELGQVIGRGGMGTVYEARRLGPFEQRVATKVVKPGLSTHEVSARFQRERSSPWTEWSVERWRRNRTR